ncbi:MAG: quinone-dependent dihydroorotate dehydrogenase, partial [Solirubrobacteraceae bacterium]
MIYQFVFKLFLQRIPAEIAHALASGTSRVLTASRRIRATLRRLTLPGDASLSVQALGLTFPTPLGAGAGLDKNANWFDALGAYGFGFVEVGTITPRRQKPNPRPTIFRVTEDRALLNRMGFPNPGAKVAARRLRKRSGETIVGASIGKARETPLKDAGADYRAVVRELAPVSDYIVINVSSPNTPGLRALEATALLGPLIDELRDELRTRGVRIPLLIKISPDLSNEDVDAIADLAVRAELDGIVAVNTTVDRTGLSPGVDQSAWFEGGGISGPPLKVRALEVLQRLYARVGDSLILISVGGIETPDDAWERILAGATLVQTHTGFIYGGPGWPRRMNRALAQRVRDMGVSSIQELIGNAAPGAGHGS